MKKLIWTLLISGALGNFAFATQEIKEEQKQEAKVNYYKELAKGTAGIAGAALFGYLFYKNIEYKNEFPNFIGSIPSIALNIIIAKPNIAKHMGSAVWGHPLLRIFKIWW